jgi:ABC-type multidrug transport system fused ATPase/permease subunit
LSPPRKKKEKPETLRERARLTWGYLKAAPRVLGLVRESSPAFAAALLLVLVGQALVPGAMAWVGKLIVDAVVEAAKLTGPAGAAARTRVFELVAIEFGLVALQTLLSRGQTLLRELLRATLGNHVNTRILEKATTLSLRHFEDADFYDKMQNARREASVRPLALVLELASLGQQVIMLVSYSLLLWRLSPWSVAVIALASLPAFIAEARLSGEGFRLNSWRAPEGRRHNYLEWILTRDSHVKEVKLLGLAPLVLARYRALYEKFYREDKALAIKRTVYGLLLGGLSLLAFYGSYAAMAGKAALGNISLGDLTLYLSLFRLGQGSFQTLLGSVAGLYESGLFVSNLFAYLDIDSGESIRANPPLRLPKGPRAIEFKDVSFRYPPQKGQPETPWALRHLSLRVEPGEKLALVGDNGAGKSTLIKLLLRLYDPTEGAVLFGGIDLRDLDPKELRSEVGVLFQDFVRYQFSALENVGLGEVAHLEDRPRIEAAIDAGGARSVIDHLPKGLDTMLGGWFEDGQELSGGQWQKIALARAFMREANLLILDEPTAALDAEAEHDLFQRLQKLAKDRTAILISHRFSTVRTADRIAVIQEGRVSELGTHAELLELKGRYAHLFELQARGYQKDEPQGAPAAMPQRAG